MYGRSRFVGGYRDEEACWDIWNGGLERLHESGKSLRETEAQLRDPKSTGDRWHGAYISRATDGDATGRNVHV